METKLLNNKSGLIGGFAKSCEKFTYRHALFVDNTFYTYTELQVHAQEIAVAINTIEKTPKALVAFLGYRSIGAYSSVLGILWSGRGYVPLNPNFPVERLAKVLNLVDATTLVVSEECFLLLPALLTLVTKSVDLVMLDYSASSKPESFVHEGSTVYISKQFSDSHGLMPATVDGENTAFVLFTSGSTGAPKGVPVKQSSICMYFDYMADRYGFTENDKFSQNSEMTFDVSILEMFCSWNSGGSLYCTPKSSLMLPVKFIKDHALTVWVSVPSVGVFMDRMRVLKPKSFPSIRICILLGEPVLASIASKWQAAAENARIEIHYGPTENTVSITQYPWNEATSPAQCINGIVPIGTVFGTQFGCVVDDKFQPVPKGAKGELCVAGGQIFNGYYNDPEKSKQKFVTIAGDAKKWYRTGDIVVENLDGSLNCLGRMDFQVKILGNRVELQEIEYALRGASGEDHTVAIPWPPHHANAEKVIGVVSSTHSLDAHKIIAECKKTLPGYMVPSAIIFVTSLPLNSNGKIDRLQVATLIEKEQYGNA